MAFRWMTAVVCGTVLAFADDLFLVRVGDEWRHTLGGPWMASGSQDWRKLGFDDRSWAMGRSGFAFNPYSYEATTLSWFDSGRCHLFRREFAIEDLDAIKWLILRIDYSGGFVAWLNGEEIVRRGLSGENGTPVAWDAPAELHNRGVPEEIDISEYLNHLFRGTNVLAIQWHHVPGASSYGTAMVAELLVNFTRGPVIQNSFARGTTVVWKTLDPTDSVVEYGPTVNMGNVVENRELTKVHAVTLTNLEPDTLYYYRVTSSLGNRRAVSPVFAFRTLRESGPFSFTAMADMGLGGVPQYTIAEVVRGSNPDIVLAVGDLVYPAYTAGREDFRFFSVYGPHMRSTPYYVVAGNHDTMVTLGASPPAFFEAFYMPTNDVSPEVHALAGTGPEYYYSFDHGDAHFAGLYVILMGSTYGLTNGSPQLQWLERDLAASTKPWKFIFVHHPVVSSNGHRKDDYNYNGIPDCVDLGNLLFPLARQYGVQMIVAGHDHVYTKFNPIGGIHSVTTGGGGGPLYWLSECDPATAQFWVRYECVKVSGDADELRMEALAEDGTVFDTMFIRRTAIPRTVFPAAWGKPCIEQQPANDGDGNVQGQMFDFVGEPIPTLPGDFSNMGRVWVNRDHDNLYLGFEQVMLYSSNVLYLFIEVPWQEGVESLVGLGNGVIDPDGEGVDGLDFAENLSFKGFRPSVACLLGDEYADGQRRSFKRPGIGLDTGQGVFRLDAGFGSIDGIRIQQYNRSPQIIGSPQQDQAWDKEQNAGFIEVAIPFAALGMTSNVGIIKLGAVVGGPGFDTSSARPSCYFDRSYLGYSMSGSGLNMVELEGVAVDLGPDLDEDGDGMTNADEIIAGTDPSDAMSVLRLEVESVAFGTVFVRWQTVPGRLYALESASDPALEFKPVAGFEEPRRAESTAMSYTLFQGAGAGNDARYYRLVVRP